MQLQNLRMTYEPFPVGVIAPVFPADFYAALLKTFPPIELFKFMPAYGNKYSLSEKNNPKLYADYIARHPAWRTLHRQIKSHDFIYAILDALRERNVDLGIKRRHQTLAGRWRRLAKNVSRGRMPVTTAPLYSRFEFSALPADDGVVVPHTDAPRKIITLVFSMVAPGEWQQSYGGGTDILRPKDPAQNFNYMNRDLDYADCEILRTVEFLPNQAMLFIKTFNSLHGVRPLKGPKGAWRRTLTVNIEYDY